MTISNINTFITQNYTVVYTGEGVDRENLYTANEFLLGDYHGSPGHNIINTLFINSFAGEQDAVLVESIPAMQKIERDESMQPVWLKTKADIIGWDTGKVGEVMNSELCQESGDNEIKGQILLRQLLDTEFKGNKDEVKLELQSTIAKQVDLFPKMLDEIGGLQQFFSKMIETIPARTESMTNTMEKVRETYKRTFLIAGQAHLNNIFENPNLSLESFYDFLKSRKAVVLLPKDEAVREHSQERVAILMDIAKPFLKH